MASEWYYEKNGSRHGPVTNAELRAMCADGRLAPGDMVWKESLPRWVKAAQLAGVRFNEDDPFLAAGDGPKPGPSATAAPEGANGGAARGAAPVGAASAPAAAPAAAPAVSPERLTLAWDEARKGGRALFRNPLDGRNRVVAPLPTFLGCLLLGPVYFLIVGHRRHALRSVVLLAATLGLSQVIYPFYAPRIMRALYFERGWKRLA